jgi:hypothetical protein
VTGKIQLTPPFFCATIFLKLEDSMIPKVMILNSGERIIAGVSEVTDENGQGLCLLLRCPYILDMVPTGEYNNEGNPSQFSIKFTKWFAYSTSDEFRVPYASVVAIGEPEEGILDVYLKRFGDKLNDSNALQPSDSSDSPEESGVPDSGDRRKGRKSRVSTNESVQD